MAFGPETRIETDEEFATFCRRMHALTGLDLASYKGGQMRRRLRSLAAREGIDHLLEYAKRLERDPATRERFLDRVTINVSELFRNPEKFDQLRDDFLRPMTQSPVRLRIWSAGCSYGAEAYSVAMILEDLTPGRGHRILATDIDARILERARKGVFQATDIKCVPPAYVKKHFAQTGPDEWTLGEDVRRRVEVRRHDLLRDPFEPGFHVILCRNVVIYFTEEAKDGLYRRFYDALAPGGILFVGGTERIMGSREIGFESPRSFFYRRPVGR